MNLIFLWRCEGLGSNNCDTCYAAQVFTSTNGIHGIVKFGEKYTVSFTLYSLVFYAYNVAMAVLQYGANISF